MFGLCSVLGKTRVQVWFVAAGFGFCHISILQTLSVSTRRAACVRPRQHQHQRDTETSASDQRVWKVNTAEVRGRVGVRALAGSTPGRKRRAAEAPRRRGCYLDDSTQWEPVLRAEAVPNRVLTVFGRVRIVVSTIRPDTNTDGSTNKQIHGFAYFDEHHAVLMLKLLPAQTI